MTDFIGIQIPRPRVKEGSAFTATAYFRASNSATTPSTAKYRIDCLTTGEEVQDWTSVTPSDGSASVSITATHNAIKDVSNRYEVKQLTIAADPDSSTQYRETAIWEVENIRGF